MCCEVFGRGVVRKDSNALGLRVFARDQAPALLSGVQCHWVPLHELYVFDIAKTTQPAGAFCPCGRVCIKFSVLCTCAPSNSATTPCVV